MESAFLIASHMLLCFGFVSKTVLVGNILAFTAPCLHSTEVFSFSHSVSFPPRQQAGWEWERRWEGSQPEQLIQTGQWDIQCCVNIMHSNKNWSREKKRDFYFDFQGGLCSELVGHLFTYRRWWGIFFALLILLFSFFYCFFCFFHMKNCLYLTENFSECFASYSRPCPSGEGTEWALV